MTTYGSTRYTRDEATGYLIEEHFDIGEGLAAFRVDVSDDNGRTYATNNLRWDNAEDAIVWAGNLGLRWFNCTNIRVVRESDNKIILQLF